MDSNDKRNSPNSILDNFIRKLTNYDKWNYTLLYEQTKQHIEGMNGIPPEIDVLVFFNFFKLEGVSHLHLINFNTLTEEQKTILSLLYISASYISCLRIIRESLHLLSPEADEKINDKHTPSENTIKSILFDCFKDDRDETLDLDSLPKISSRKLYTSSPPPPLRLVFNHLTSIKSSFHFYLELFYHYYGSIEHIPFDRTTYDVLFESITTEDYERFRDFIYKCDDKVVNQMSIMVETVYPILHHLESQTTDFDKILYHIKKDMNTTDDFRAFLVFSPIRVMINLLFIYVIRNIVEQYLTEIERKVHYMVFKQNTKGFVSFFFGWINNAIESISDFIQNNPDYNLLDSIVTEISDASKDNRNDEGTASQVQQKTQQQRAGSCGDNEGQPFETPKQHLSAGHDIETIKKLATYLVKGFTNPNGSLPALVSSTEGNPINQLIFLFTGNQDYFFEGPYKLTWNAEQVYLNLLIKLLYNLNELATPSHAIDKTKDDYISQKFVICKFRGVWGKVAAAFTNTSEASLRNAKYTNYKDTEALINKKRREDMKLIAAMWLKCKDDIDC